MNTSIDNVENMCRGGLSYRCFIKVLNTITIYMSIVYETID